MTPEGRAAPATATLAVIGGRSSNNTRELVRTCARYCDRVHHVETDLDLLPEWFEAAEAVGLTAGTSTPDEVIDRVEARIREIETQIETRTRKVAEAVR